MIEELRGSAADPLRESWDLQSAVSSRGFDWPDIAGVFAKVREEIDEVEEAWQAGDRAHAARELGDVLFALVNLGRFLDADPGRQLAETNRRFADRFAELEAIVRQKSKTVEDCSLEELDAVWEEVKRARQKKERDA